MAKAGFWAIDPTRKISFGKDGWWYANDERIENRRINLLFSQHLRKTPEGAYEIAIGWDKVAVVIEDVPYVVTQVTGDPLHGFLLRLNDESEEPLDPTTLSVGQDNVLYCRVKGGEHRARFLRPAYYQLATYIQEAGEGGGFFLPLGDAAYPIQVSFQ
ncbi:MAG TPA: hypothetical protein VNN62_15925 [Methylomirabilota bacterium]|jgi:hypothetical protein|nr:hypothetical protein [Methylomirabilota bacterium]